MSEPKYQQQIDLHNRSIDIISAKVKAIERLKEAKRLLTNWDKGYLHSTVRMLHDRQPLQRDVSVLERYIRILSGMYSRISEKYVSVWEIVVKIYILT